MFVLIETAKVLARYGATAEEIEELLTYNQNIFNSTALSPNQTFPLESEPHVTAWKRYYSHAQEIGVFAVLRSALVQLQFPIQAGISQTNAYRATTRKGYSTDNITEATGLDLQHPESLQLAIHPTLAGEIPVIIAGCRADFVMLVQALTKRNEPELLPDSMGATIVAGYNNWERIRYYRQEWEAKQSPLLTGADWQAEFQRLKLEKHLYQDCFIILSQGNYSAIPAEKIGIDEEEWLRLSLIIRLEHECCHYFTRRVFGSMRNNMLDELIADYQGIVAANNGRYRADWFLRFIGLEDFPSYREGGRLQNYRGKPPLSEGAFKILQILIKDAAENLEQFNILHQGRLKTPGLQAKLLEKLTFFTLMELATESKV